MSNMLVRGARTAEERFDQPENSNLTAVAHVPLAVWVALDLAHSQPIPDGRVAKFRGYRDRIAVARSTVTPAAFPPSMLDRQFRMLDASIAILDEAIVRHAIAGSELEAFTRRMAPFMRANV